MGGSHRVAIEAQTGGGEVFHGFKMSDDKTCLGGYKTIFSMGALECATKCRVASECVAFSSEFGGRQACILHMDKASCDNIKRGWMIGIRATRDKVCGTIREGHKKTLTCPNSKHIMSQVKFATFGLLRPEVELRLEVPPTGAEMAPFSQETAQNGHVTQGRWSEKCTICLAVFGLAEGDTVPVAAAGKSGEFGVSNWQIDVQFSKAAAVPGSKMITGDFDGDKLTDVVALKSLRKYGLTVALARAEDKFDVKQTITDAAKDFAIYSSTDAAVTVGDMNGDGKDDIMLSGVTFKPLGCFYEKSRDSERAMSVYVGEVGTNMPSQCAMTCKNQGYTFSALQMTKCYCGRDDSWTRYGEATEELCMPCTKYGMTEGGDAVFCGSERTISAYTSHVPVLPIAYSQGDGSFKIKMENLDTLGKQVVDDNKLERATEKAQKAAVIDARKEKDAGMQESQRADREQELTVKAILHLYPRYSQKSTCIVHWPIKHGSLTLPSPCR
jgi:hypothetical protein